MKAFDLIAYWKKIYPRMNRNESRNKGLLIRRTCRAVKNKARLKAMFY
jgi:hypothetical protein